jgi:hypothetical protein
VSITAPPVEFRDDNILVIDNMVWDSGFLNDCFGDMTSLDDLTCDIDIVEDPEWTNIFMNEYLGDSSKSASKPGLHNEIPSQDNTGWIDQLSPNTLEAILSEIGDFTPEITDAIQKTRGGAMDDSMPSPTIEVNDSSSNSETVSYQHLHFPIFSFLTLLYTIQKFTAQNSVTPSTL